MSAADPDAVEPASRGDAWTNDLKSRTLVVGAATEGSRSHRYGETAPTAPCTASATRVRRPFTLSAGSPAVTVELLAR
jgi:hypothetical protein